MKLKLKIFLISLGFTITLCATLTVILEYSMSMGTKKEIALAEKARLEEIARQNAIEAEAKEKEESVIELLKKYDKVEDYYGGLALVKKDNKYGYVDFEGNTQKGELICNKAIAQDLLEIFKELHDASYQIDKIRLIDEYGGDDDLSCADNNTSCFNYRVVGGTDNLSKHALGLAIDINPFQNPYITYPNGVERISPPGSEAYADRDSGLDHMILEGDLCYNLFIEHGFTWGGHWHSLKDYQHFQKTF